MKKKRSPKQIVQHLMEQHRLTRKLYQYIIFQKRRMQALCYRFLPIREDLVVFEAYKGKKYACNPKALYLAMTQEPYAGKYTFVWVFAKKRTDRELTDNPATTIAIRNSKAHLKACMTAKYRITNSSNDRYLPVRKGQIYMQTWHGTPLKRLGCDILVDGNSAQTRSEIRKQYLREKKGMTYLLSPSPYATKHLATAFGMDEQTAGEKILELGYPRNDFLFSYTKEDVACIKEKMKIPPEKKVVLYAPTFRETGYHLGQGFQNEIKLDADRLRQALGDECVVVLRTHYLAKTSFDFKSYQGFLFNGNPVDDINELYVISDLLVTDYSSVMFDYSILKRPMVFYMYDLENYRENLRDFYMEPDELPGPLVKEQQDMEQCVLSLLHNFVCDDKYAQFNEKFHPYDDAHRSEVLLEKLLRGNSEK